MKSFIAVVPLAVSAFGWADHHVDIVCPCRVETTNLTSIRISFGIRNYRAQGESGSLTAALEGRLSEGGSWQKFADVHLDSVAADSRQEFEHVSAFRAPEGSGEYELRFSVYQGTAWLDSIHWFVDRTTLSPDGGSSRSGVYFDGTPTVDIDEGSATVSLPALRNGAEEEPAADVSVALLASAGLSLEDGLVVGEHRFDRNLEAGGEIESAEIEIATRDAEGRGYYHLTIRDGAGTELLHETVVVPEGEGLPTRTIATGDADLLVDSDEDGVGDVNERLVGTDPADPESTPEDSTVDVLALYSPGFPGLYRGDPTTRIRHLITVADNTFLDSGVDLRLRLVGIRETSVDETRFLEGSLDSLKDP